MTESDIEMQSIDEVKHSIHTNGELLDTHAFNTLAASFSKCSRQIKWSFQLSILNTHVRSSLVLGILLLSPLLEHKPLQLSIRVLKIIVNDDQVMCPGRLGVLELEPRLSETLLDRLFFLGASTAETLFEDGHGWGRDEDVACFDVGVFDLLDALTNPY